MTSTQEPATFSGTIDLYVDGVFCAYRHTEDLSLKQVKFALPAGRHRVTVYLPWFAKVVIRQVRLSDGACVLPVKKSRRLLAFGDSITQGYTANFSSLSYVNQVARQLDVEVLNQGVGGYFFDAATLEELAAYAAQLGSTEGPGSGRQEYLESVVNQVMFG